MATLPVRLRFYRVIGCSGCCRRPSARPWPDQCSWACFAAGALVLAQGRLLDQLALIASGTVNIEDPDLGWTLQLQAGECFGAGVTPAPCASQVPGRAG